MLSYQIIHTGDATKVSKYVWIFDFHLAIINSTKQWEEMLDSVEALQTTEWESHKNNSPQ